MPGIEHPRRWSNRMLWALIWPLMVEQLLAVTIGIADTVMVTAAGEAAVSGISLVDSLNNLLITLFSALATGGAVVVSQYIGKKDHKNASLAARQLIYSITVLSIVIMLAALVLRRPMLQLIYGHIEADVMKNAETYFWLSALSYPFLALYNAGAALFRSMGNSRVSMLTAFLVNLINISGNAILVYGMGWGVAGAATASLVSRAVSGLVIMVLLMRLKNAAVSLRGLFKFDLCFPVIKSILNIGIPSGIESSIFLIGKLMTSRVISVFGTTAIAANAIGGVIFTFIVLSGNAIGLAMITVVGQCIGAKDYSGANHYAIKLVKLTYVTVLSSALIVAIFGKQMLGWFNISPEAIEIAYQALLACIFFFPFWPISFTLPNALRAAGDVRFTMVVSMVSMWTIRIGLSIFLSTTLGMGVLGVWIAMSFDWVARGIFFVFRWRSGKWKEKRVIS